MLTVGVASYALLARWLGIGHAQDDAACRTIQQRVKQYNVG